MSDDKKDAGKKRPAVVKKAAGDRTERFLRNGIIAVLVAVVAVVGFFIVYVFQQSKPSSTLAEQKVATLESVIKQQPNMPQAWADYVDALVANQNFDKAQSAVKTGLAQTSGAAVVMAQQGRLWLAMGNTGEAVKTLKAALVKAESEKAARIAAEKAKGIWRNPVPDKNVIECGVLLGQALSRQGSWQEAVDAFSTALAEDPSQADVLTARGDAYLKLHRPADAEKDFTASLQYVPGDAKATAGLKEAQTGAAR